MILCSSCHGGCCRRYPVDLTGFDIINIVRNMMLNVSVFIELVPAKIKDEAELEKKMKGHALFKFKGSDNYFRLCLKRTKSFLMPDTYKCVFLQEWHSEGSTNNIAGRCGIYSLRPKVCEAYPMTFDKKGLFAYIYDPALKDKNFPNNNPAYQICPETLTVENFGKYVSDYKINQTLAVFKFEKDFFREIAVQWNTHAQGTFEEFLLKLQKIYDNRIQGPVNQENIKPKNTRLPGEGAVNKDGAKTVKKNIN